MTREDSIERMLDAALPPPPPSGVELDADMGTSSYCAPQRGRRRCPSGDTEYLKAIVEGETATIRRPPTPTTLRFAAPPRRSPENIQALLDQLLDVDSDPLEDADTVPLPRSPRRSPRQWRSIATKVGLGVAWVAHLAAIVAACC